MKKLLFFVLAVMLSVPVLSQSVVQEKKGRVPSEKKAVISTGLLQGGGGLVGIDFEYLIGQHFSAQAGIGVVSFGGALNYHFKPYINSSMISLVYMHQGVGNSYVASWLGPMYTFRAPKIFQVSGGFVLKVGDGPNTIANLRVANAGLMFSIGVYFPI